MPHNAIQIMPGVDTTKTQALNQAGISQSNFVRFLPDRQGASLVQKLGGWISYYTNTAITTAIRALNAWADLKSNDWLGIGSLSSLVAYSPQGGEFTITPTTTTTNPAPNFTCQSGVLLTESGNGITTESGQNLQVSSASQTITVVDSGVSGGYLIGDLVYIETPVSVGGGTIQGLYPIASIVSSTSYTITIPYLPTLETTNGGAVPIFTIPAGSATVTVTYPNHNYVVGQNIAYAVSTTVGGVVIYGEYTVSAVIDENTYQFVAATKSTPGATNVAMNSGNVLNLYYLYNSPGGAGVGGYGLGGYGQGGYGIGNGGSAGALRGTAITATDWFLNNYGQLLVANQVGGPIFNWQPLGSAATAQVFNNSPVANNGCFVAMPQQQIVAWGSTFTGIIDPLLIRWCDVGDPTSWIGTAVNQAGSYRIPEGSAIIAAMQAQQQAIFWTDTSVWSMQYIGAPLVYSFNKIASGVGAIGPKSVGLLNNAIFWMSPSQFNMLSPQGVTSIPCPIWDVIFQNLNTTYVSNIRCAPNSLFNEIWWFYPSAASTDGENDSYVKYNVTNQTWDYGSLGRSAWIDQSVLGPPIGAGTDYTIYQHEVGNNDGTDAMTPSFETGYFALSEGDQMIFIDQMWPDMKWGDYSTNPNASIQITFFGTNYPGDTPTQYGPYTVTQGTQYISTRIRNRLLAFQVSSSDLGSFWRLGNIRYRYQPDGKY
jgi:hypothetical protein